MTNCSLLSGAELLQKGLEKGERTLPVKGEKVVAPSGAWVQQAQIQLALDARRQLIGDERVEKWGSLSRAEWEEEEGLARVTELHGGHWAYVGHCRARQYYLLPEEALFLMEKSCLALTFGGIQISLQQAYSLLLRGKITAREYKVYSQLSRVGYRVLRSTVKTLESSDGEADDSACDVTASEIKTENSESNEKVKESSTNTKESIESNEKVKKNIININESIESNEIVKESITNTKESIESLQNEIHIQSENKEDISQSNENMNVEDNPQNNDMMNKKDLILEVGDSGVQEIRSNGGLLNNDLSNNQQSKDDKQSTSTQHNIQMIEATEVIKCEQSSENHMEKELSTNKENSQINKIKEGSNNNSDNIKQNEDWRSFPTILVMGPMQSEENMQSTNTPQKHQSTSSTPNKKHQQPPKFLRGHTKRRTRSLSSLELPDYFQDISNIAGEHMVRMTAPDETFLPRNVFLNRTEYLLKIDTINSKPSLTNSNTAAQGLANVHINNRNTPQGPMHTDPMIDTIFRNQFLRSAFYNRPQPPPFMPFPFFMFPNRRFQRYGPRNNAFRYAYNMFSHQRPFYPNRFNMPFQYFGIIGNEDEINLAENREEGNRKRKQEDNCKQMEHLQAIRRLTCRLKKIHKNGHGSNWEHRNSLKKLVEAYNSRYNENIQVSDNLTILNDFNDNETIDLEEEELLFGKRRRQRASGPTDSDRINLLQSIKQLAARLKQLREAGERCFRIRRSLLESIKMYNKKFDASICLTSAFEVKDSKQIVLDSSSDSDCFVTDNMNYEDSRSNQRKHTNVSKRVTHIRDEPMASTSKAVSVDTPCNTSMTLQAFYDKYDTVFQKWLPRMEDWGHADVVPSILCKKRIIYSHQQEYVYNYLSRYRGIKYRDWSQLKSEFWDNLEGNQMEVDQREEEVPQSHKEVHPCNVEPLLSPDDGTNVATALDKIRIIKTHTHEDEEIETAFTVVFDVYEKDVKNFRKSDLPTPTFRIVCVDERGPVPDACEVAALQAPYSQVAPLVLAAVGSGVSYVQLDATDLPPYVRKRFL